MNDTDLQRQASEFLRLFAEAAQSSSDVQSEAFSGTREFLKDLAKSRMEQGFTPEETALFVLSLKQPIFNARGGAVKASAALIDEIGIAGTLLDRLAMLTVTSAIGFREQTIVRQQEEMLELSTPVVKLWDGVLALPLIGTLDSARTQVCFGDRAQCVPIRPRWHGRVQSRCRPAGISRRSDRPGRRDSPYRHGHGRFLSIGDRNGHGNSRHETIDG